MRRLVPITGRAEEGNPKAVCGRVGNRSMTRVSKLYRFVSERGGGWVGTVVFLRQSLSLSISLTYRAATLFYITDLRCFAVARPVRHCEYTLSFSETPHKTLETIGKESEESREANVYPAVPVGRIRPGELGRRPNPEKINAPHVSTTTRHRQGQQQHHNKLLPPPSALSATARIVPPPLMCTRYTLTLMIPVSHCTKKIPGDVHVRWEKSLVCVCVCICKSSSTCLARLLVLGWSLRQVWG